MQTEELEGSPTALRVMGDFMLELSEEEYPAFHIGKIIKAILQSGNLNLIGRIA